MITLYLLQVDVIQVMGAAHCLHHPALWCDHIKGEQWRFWELHETGNWPWRHRLVGQESYIRLQDKAVKTVKRAKHLMKNYCKCCQLRASYYNTAFRSRGENLNDEQRILCLFCHWTETTITPKKCLLQQALK